MLAENLRSQSKSKTTTVVISVSATVLQSLLYQEIVGLFYFISAHEQFVKHEIYLNIA